MDIDFCNNTDFFLTYGEQDQDFFGAGRSFIFFSLERILLDLFEVSASNVEEPDLSILFKRTYSCLQVQFLKINNEWGRGEVNNL